MGNHRWSEEDDIAALYLYLHGERRDVLDAVRSRGVSDGSLNMRISNFQALDRGGGLPNVARQTETVYQKYRKLSEAELRRLAIGE